MTALDLARIYNQTAVTKILEDKEAKTINEIYKAPTTTDYVLSGSTYAEKVSRGYYNLTQQLTLDMRNTILVVATLIVAATYQGVLQPPGGVYPADDVETLSMGRRLLGTGTNPESSLHPILGRKLLGNPESSLRPILGRKGEDTWKKPTAGKMVMKKDKYRYYMPCNTFAFALSMVIVIFVVPGSPVFLILHLCLLFMCISYVLALDAIAFYTCISDTIYAMSLYAIVGAYVVKLLYYPVKALLVDEDWWLRGLGVKFANRCSVTKWFFSDTLVMMKQQHLVLRLS
ncbi:uncharacterized protein LOC125210285 [Salvia hispanica]|uniref:uncharacterized protein LOC125210285 n=1 Tax=Salvia hispanica TaxID=49212 RepID=UPI002009726C|nr:uncharacterized protein LOC125210285 [Salvia hispanica]